MYELIIPNIGQLPGTVSRSDFDPYLWMIQQLHNLNVSENPEFQREYLSVPSLCDRSQDRSDARG
jgi:hypothetical protein